jgi:hypothetical protein
MAGFDSPRKRRPSPYHSSLTLATAGQVDAEQVNYAGTPPHLRPLQVSCTEQDLFALGAVSGREDN